MFVFFQCSCVHVPQCPTLCSLYDIKTARTKSSRASRCPDKTNILRGVVHDGCLMIFAWPCCLDLKTHANTEEFDVIIADLQQPQPLHSWNLEKTASTEQHLTLSMAIICYLALLQRIFLSAHWTQWLHTCQSLFEELLQLCQRLLSVQFLARGPFLHAKMIKGVWYLHMFARSFVTTLWVSGPMLPVKPCEVS